jgi:hypothetical protein
MTREYVLGANRRVVVDKKNGEFFVTIEEPGTEKKSVTLTAKRWAALVASEPLIDQSVNSLQGDQYVKFSTHIGGAYFISVTSGYKCVDFREFYFNKTKAASLPTRHGIALTLDQWPQLKEIIQLIRQHFPKLAKTEMCTHTILSEMLECKECHPYKDSMDLTKQPPLNFY